MKEIEISEIKDNFKERKTGESFLSLLPPRFLGYSTQEKFWGQFSVDFTHPVSNKKTGDKFKDELQLGVEYKQMIHALVSSHQSQNVTRDSNSPAEIKDVVENKGKGLVILLHGPPGVGKTVSVILMLFSFYFIDMLASSQPKLSRKQARSHFLL